MEEILRIVTIYYDGDTRSERRVLAQETLLCRISDVYLPQYNTGYVYILISIKDLNYMSVCWTGLRDLQAYSLLGGFFPIPEQQLGSLSL